MKSARNVDKIEAQLEEAEKLLTRAKQRLTEYPGHYLYSDSPSNDRYVRYYDESGHD